LALFGRLYSTRKEAAFIYAIFGAKKVNSIFHRGLAPPAKYWCPFGAKEKTEWVKNKSYNSLKIGLNP